MWSLHLEGPVQWSKPSSIPMGCTAGQFFSKEKLWPCSTDGVEESLAIMQSSQKDHKPQCTVLKAAFRSTTSRAKR